MLCAMRRVPEALAAERAGGWVWSPTFMAGADLFRARVGIVGLGRIGTRAPAKREGSFA